VVALKKFSFLALQVYPENSDCLYRAYLEATCRPHWYLIMNFWQETDDRVRLRMNVFPDEIPPVIYTPVNDEANKIELPCPARVKRLES